MKGTIYLGHATNRMIPAKAVYCGRNFRGFKDCGLGNPKAVYQGGKAGWQERYLAWLRQPAQKPARELLKQLALDVRSGVDVLLQCWCFEMVQPYCVFSRMEGDPLEAKCHTQIIAYAIKRYVEVL